jgi:hypothetical protein
MAAFPFQHPFTGICSGPTGSGKTELMKRILLSVNKMMTPKPHRIVWYYAERQPQLEQSLRSVTGLEFRQGLPELSEFGGQQPALLIVDDFMAEADTELTKLFTKGSHHRNLSIWFLMQNFFHKGKEIRSITLNAQYVILFKNPRDRLQVEHLARQMYGARDSKVMEEAFRDATANPHGYLLIDLKQSTPEHLRLRTNILPGEALAVYVNARGYKENRIEVVA